MIRWVVENGRVPHPNTPPRFVLAHAPPGRGAWLEVIRHPCLARQRSTAIRSVPAESNSARHAECRIAGPYWTSHSVDPAGTWMVGLGFVFEPVFSHHSAKECRSKFPV